MSCLSDPSSFRAPIPGWRVVAAFLLVVLLAGLGAAPASASSVPWREADIDVHVDLAEFSLVNDTTATMTLKVAGVDNTSGAAQRTGLYVGWIWAYLYEDWNDLQPEEVPFSWSNAQQAYVGSDTTWNTTIRLTLSAMTGSGAALPVGALRLADLPAPSMADVLVQPGYVAMGITASGDWQLPLLDLGLLAPGLSDPFDIVFTLEFSSEAAARAWADAGDLYPLIQGVVAVPEPGSLALVGVALAALAAGARRRPSRSAPLPG